MDERERVSNYHAISYPLVEFSVGGRAAEFVLFVNGKAPIAAMISEGRYHSGGTATTRCTTRLVGTSA